MRKYIVLGLVMAVLLAMAGVSRAEAPVQRRNVMEGKELEFWSKSLGLTGDELTAYLKAGMPVPHLVQAFVLAREQKTTIKAVLDKAKADKVGMVALAYGSGIKPDKYAELNATALKAMLEQAVAEGVYTKEQLAPGQIMRRRPALLLRPMMRPMGRMLMRMKARACGEDCQCGQDKTDQPIMQRRMFQRGFRMQAAPEK